VLDVYAKFRCALLRIKKALGIFRVLITTTTRVLIECTDKSVNTLKPCSTQMHFFGNQRCPR